MERIIINKEKCKSCGLCIHYCKQECLKLSEEFNSSGYHPAIFVNEDKCNSCGFCYLICPDVAIEIIHE